MIDRSKIKPYTRIIIYNHDNRLKELFKFFKNEGYVLGDSKKYIEESDIGFFENNILVINENKNLYLSRIRTYDGYTTYDLDDVFETQKKSVVIHVDGTNTVAKYIVNKKVEKTAMARLHPDDSYDFEIGAKIAFDRLFGEEQKNQYYSGKVVCVKSFGDFDVGRIYEFKNGYIKTNRGEILPAAYPVETFDDVKRSLMSQFIEVIE